MGGIYDTVFTEQQLEVKDEVAFMNAAKKKIPQLLRKYSSVHIKIGRWREDNRNRPDLTKLVVSVLCIVEVLPGDGTFGKKRCVLMGYAMGYLAILTGHRPVVFTKMTRQHVLAAETWAGGKKFRILVSI